MSSRRVSLAATALLAVGVLTSATPLFAQPPRPAVSMRRHPTMFHSVWPADFNRDGHIDFVAGEPPSTTFPYPPGRVVVRLGNGGGGVGQPIATGVTGRPATIGDFNRDGFIDVVAIEDRGAMWILAGRGNGTFEAPRGLVAIPDFYPFTPFALASDVNADGHLDLVVGGGAVVEVRPGRGDLTFGTAVTLPQGGEEEVTAAVAADLNRDGRRDLVVAQRRRSILVYMNAGRLMFTPSEIVIEEFEEPDEIHGLAAGDLNRDGLPDLVVPHAQGIFDYGEGGVDVLIGRGDGTFAPGARYATGVNGPWTATTGDFNRDGLVDVAVGGRSWTWDDLSDIFSYWDSVAVFPGRGNGLLAPAAVFRLDTTAPLRPINSPWVHAHHALRAADVNGDGHADLVASPLAILLNRVPTPNRPPTADAGPDLVDRYGETSIVAVRMTEPDWDWLRVEWRDETGRVITRNPSFEFNTLHDKTLTVTVTDARGATATDTVVVRRDPDHAPYVTLRSPVASQRYPAGSAISIRWEAYSDPSLHHFDIEVSRDGFRSWMTLVRGLPGSERGFTWMNAGPPGATWWIRIYALRADHGALAEDTSDPFTIETTPAGPFPWPWQEHGNIGAPGQAGSASYSSGTFNVSGAGVGVGGTADEFHFVSTRSFSRSEYGALGFSITARVSGLEQVTDQTRAGLSIRDGFGAGASHVSIFLGPSSAAGVTFETRSGTGAANVRTRVSSIGAPAWIKLVNSFGMIRAYVRKNRSDRWIMIGEHTLTPGTSGPMHLLLAVSSGSGSAAALARFDNVAIDETETMHSLDYPPGIEGNTTTDGVTTSIEAAGANIWGRADSFRYHYGVADLSRGGSITVRVLTLENTHAVAKAGIMIRAGYDPGAPHVSLFVTPGGGVRLQYRATLHAESFVHASRAGTAPERLRLTRNGNVFTAFASEDGVTWNRVGGITLPFPELTTIGLGVTSRDPAVRATAEFDDLVVRP